MADLVIRGGRILTMDGAIIDNGVVVVDIGLINFPGKTTNEKAEKTIDAEGCAVMPGLVNAHTHLSMTLFRGFADNLPYDEWTRKIQQAEMKLTPAGVRAGAGKDGGGWEGKKKKKKINKNIIEMMINVL